MAMVRSTLLFWNPLERIYSLCIEAVQRQRFKSSLRWSQQPLKGKEDADLQLIVATGFVVAIVRHASGTSAV